MIRTAGLFLALLTGGIATGGQAAPAAPAAPAASVPALPPKPVAKPADKAAAAAPQSAHALDAADLEAWLDGLMPATLQQGKVAGAVVSVVKDGKVILAKGYGYADAKTKAPMDAERTLVRPGSTSKLFTWTAVMQLVEQGKLDLDADINRYLDFKVPERFGKPITLNDLMTHRGGFQEGLRDALVTDPKALQPLDVFLKQHLPPVLFAPGKVPAYSNYGTALAGYIVQRVSGEPYEAYVERHIFTPLGMTHSTFRQPLPASFADDMSKGYRSSAADPRPYELVSFGPAGGLAATAADMAKFMIAHLQDGRLGTGQILRPDTAQLMHQPTFAGPAGFDVMAHGFFRNQRNGRVTLEHGGDTIIFHSDLEIIPSEQTGIFLSFNSRGEGDAVYGMRERLLDGFMDRYFPAPKAADAPALASAKADAARIAGHYETSRRVQSGFISLFYVLQGQDEIVANPDGTIALASAPAKSFREVAPDLWREAGGSRELKLETVDGVRTVADSRNPAGVLQAVPLSRDAKLNLPVFLGTLLVLLGAALLWPISAFARRYYAQADRLTGRPRLARRLARIATVADLVYLGAWFVVLKPILSSDVAFYTTALDPLVRTLQLAFVVPLLGAVAGIWHAALTLRSDRGWGLKLGSLAVAAALLGMVWIAWVGGLADWTLNY